MSYKAHDRRGAVLLVRRGPSAASGRVMTRPVRNHHGGLMRAGRAIVISAHRVLALAAAIATASRAAPAPPAAPVRPAPASPHLLYHR